MLFAKDFRGIARQALTNRWGVAVGTGLVASLLGSSLGVETPSFDWRSTRDVGNIHWGSAETVFLAGFISIAFVWVMIIFFLGGAITLGYCRFNKNLIEGKPAQFNDLFSRFDMFWKGFVLQFLRGLYVLLWSLLLIIPGIIAAFRYSMAPFILEENPEMTPSEAIDLSKEMMYGNKWRLFCLELSFIGWGILSIFTCGIGYLWLGPYTSAAITAFYYEVSGKFKAFEDQQNNQL